MVTGDKWNLALISDEALIFDTEPQPDRNEASNHSMVWYISECFRDNGGGFLPLMMRTLFDFDLVQLLMWDLCGIISWQSYFDLFAWRETIYRTY